MMPTTLTDDLADRERLRCDDPATEIGGHSFALIAGPHAHITVLIGDGTILSPKQGTWEFGRSTDLVAEGGAR